MAFLGDLIVRIGANANPFTNAMKKGQATVRAFKDSLTDMRTTAAVFAKLAASIKAVNNQMDRLVHVSKGALAATQNLAKVEHTQATNRLRELKMIQSMQEKQVQPQRRTSMFDIAGGIGIAQGVSAAAGAIKDMALGTVRLAADAQVMRSEFSVLLGDVNKGASMFAELEKFAARTSFDLASAADAARSLMAAGVKEGDLLNTMQLLGDLSLGDANKLQFLSKAYTDVFNKGRLQGQEIKQFAENGVGLVQALSATLKKPAGEILKMSEDGQISFVMMQTALKSLTAEGGRFFGAMEARNKTFWGQWDSTIEAIQSTGRALGEMVLPRLTEIISEANKMVTAFNSLGDGRWKFAGELLIASFDVAMETIKLHWADMINDMLDKISKVNWAKLLNPFASVNINDLRPDSKPQDLAAAQGRLDGLLGKLDAAKLRNGPAESAPLEQQKSEAFSAWTKAGEKSDKLLKALEAAERAYNAAPESSPERALLGAGVEASIAALRAANGDALSKESTYNAIKDAITVRDAEQEKTKSQDAFNSGISSMWDKLKSSPIASTLESVKMGAGGMIDRAKINAEAIGGMFSNWLGSPDWEKDKDKAKQAGPSYANSMQKGSQEAFSTILSDILGSRKDPMLKATEKQTTQIVGAINKQKPTVQPKFAPEFA